MGSAPASAQPVSPFGVWYKRAASGRRVRSPRPVARPGRVCWVGGWDKCRVLFVVMIGRPRRARTVRSAHRFRSANSASGDSKQGSTDIGLRAVPVCGVQQYNSHFSETGNSIILTCMPTKLQKEILTAAIAGFEEQKKRLNARIADLRQMLSPSAPDGSAPTPTRRRMSAAARARIAAAQRRRWAAVRKQSGAASSVAPTRKKRKLSAAGRKAIIEATTRRWAALRKANAR
jgi:hypothetical protein